MKKKKKILILILIIVVLGSCIYGFQKFIKNDYKFSELGNTISNKSIEEIEDMILNISSYQAKATITIKSNKNENTYEMKQQYIAPNQYHAEVLKPGNLAGLTFSYDGNQLKVENTRLQLSKIYEQYPYLNENHLFLSRFVKDYQESQESKIIERSEEVIMETKIKNSNQYQMYEKLYMDKRTGKITKLEVQDVTQNTLVYILYNEIEINSLKKQDILAFRMIGDQRGV